MLTVTIGEIVVILREIGQQLDQNIFPLVKNGGFVMPSESVIPLSNMGEENGHAKSKRQNRPKTRSRKRTTRRKGAASGNGTTCSTTPLISSSLREKYLAELDAVNDAYPGTQIWQQKEGMWLLCHSGLLPDSMDNAVFLCAIPFEITLRLRSWAFWNGRNWIGPRHTNLPDGSICAFEPSDGTWLPGDSIVKLLDIYSLWAVRHLYLQKFNYWPGPQVAHYAYERLTESNKDELCGCGSLNRRYEECCLEKDLKRNRIADAIKFILLGGADRHPPVEVTKFMKERGVPPLINDL